MTAPHPMVETWRGPLPESLHAGHAVICDGSGQTVAAWGNPDAIIYPRSSAKMMQALPMVEAGVRLSSERLALACASHEGADSHVAHVRAWLDDLDLADNDLLCGTEASRDRKLRMQHDPRRRSALPDAQPMLGQACGLFAFQPPSGQRRELCRPGPSRAESRARCP